MARSPTASSLLLLLFFLSSSLLSITLGAEIRITDAQGLIDLSNNVNSGTTYYGTTVFLDSDIDFSGGYSEQFAPIGFFEANGNVNPFNGVFDGQGHTISNLKVNSSSLESVGLVGNSQGGIIIQNVVIDGSCSFASSKSSEDFIIYSYVGSTIGRCSSTNEPCTIESVVNLGSVLFDGNISGVLFAGGIVGAFNSYAFINNLKNCVNYGSITSFGKCYVAEMGGIAGSSDTQSTHEKNNYIQNCLNYGTITHNGISDIPALGGIAGNSQYTTFENCVSSGAISSNKESEYIGGILGGITTDTNITHCFWTSDVGNVNAYGFNEDKVNVTNSSLATLDQTTLDKLNRYITEEEKDSTWSKWVMLYLNGGRINNINQQSLVGITSALAVPVREGNAFLFWCKDAVCGEVFDPNTDDVSTLYAGWKINNYTVTFDLGNGTVLNESFTFNTSIEYPKGMVREGHTLSWNPNPALMPAVDITIKAQWTINNYTVTFDLGNGTVLDEVFTFNASIEYPKGMVREGYTFNGWDSTPELMPPMDITIKAQWTEKVESKAVEIVFDTKDITSKDEEEMKEEIRKIIEVYTNEDFVIERIDTDPETGEAKVIIKFVDSEKAAEFVRVMNENKRSDSSIKSAKTSAEYSDFSSPREILSLFSLIFIM